MSRLVPHWLQQMWINRPSKVRQRLAARSQAFAAVGITDSDVNELAAFNSWSGKALFSDAYRERMALVQERFDQASRRPWL